MDGIAKKREPADPVNEKYLQAVSESRKKALELLIAIAPFKLVIFFYIQSDAYP